MGPGFDISLQALFVTFVGMIPRQVFYFYAMVRLLDVPRPRLTFLVCAVLSLTLSVGAMPLPLPARIVGFVALCSPPFILARDRLTLKVFVAVAAVLVFAASDLANGVLWYMLTGSEPTHELIDSNAPLFATVSAMSMVFFAVLFLGFGYFAGKYLNSEVRRYSGEGTKYFVLFPLLQLPLLGAIGSCAFAVGPQWNTGVALLLFALGLLCLGSDLFLFYVVEQFVLERIEAARVSSLQQRLDDDMRRYRELAIVLENSAQFRHDLRNHTQVIDALVERGDFARARQCVAELLEAVERVNASENEALASLEGIRLGSARAQAARAEIAPAGSATTAGGASVQDEPSAKGGEGAAAARKTAPMATVRAKDAR